jgi:serine/threonine-protein kinase
MKENEVIEFTRTKPFKFIKNTGNGGLGETVLLKDEIIDELFVCKKYAPYSDSLKGEYFDNFKSEIKLLHLLYHKNVVRVFNYYLYPEHSTGYILMEYVNGTTIINYIDQYPENINDIFIQTIDGFKYLEEHDILHRDIRPYNIMVGTDGVVKIIDFGFGKKIHYQQDFDKSISLNPWCDSPNEFNDKIYDFKTEIYFVGKLFEKAIVELEIEEFKFKTLLSKMIQPNPKNRIETFHDCYKEILTQESSEIEFNEYELNTYRTFSYQLNKIILEIENSTKFINDPEKILKKLETLHKNTMLEQYLPSSSLLSSCFLDGAYRSINDIYVDITTIKDFIHLLKSSSQSKKNIIINNLETKIEVIKRYSNDIPEIDINDDEIPF